MKMGKANPSAQGLQAGSDRGCSGVIRPTERSECIPPFIVMEVLERAHELEREGRRIIHMEIGEPDFPTPESICRGAIEAIQAGHTHYTHSLGILELRVAICTHYHKKYRAGADHYHLGDFARPVYAFFSDLGAG